MVKEKLNYKKNNCRRYVYAESGDYPYQIPIFRPYAKVLTIFAVGLYWPGIRWG